MPRQRYVGEEDWWWDEYVHPRHRLRPSPRQVQAIRDQQVMIPVLVDNETPEDVEARETFERMVGEPPPVPLPLATIGNEVRFAKAAAVVEELPAPPPIPEPPREYVARVEATEMECQAYEGVERAMQQTALGELHEAMTENPPKIAAVQDDNSTTLTRHYHPMRRVGWHMDCRSTAATCTCTVAMSDLVWTNWNAVRVVSSTTGTAWDNDPWRTWNVTSTSTTNSAVFRYVWNVWTEDHVRKTEVRLVNEREAAEREARYREQRAREEIERKARVSEIAAARERAEKLLLSALTPEQKEELKTKRYFSCRSQKGNLYRIYKGTHGNVKRVEGGREVEKLCIQPDNVPDEDAMLAQKLHIEFNEDDFRKTANITRLVN